MSLELKHQTGWFAAGIEVQQALMKLSDGAFKLFIHLCLTAPRHSGLIQTTQSELARTLHKTNHTIRKYLLEMQHQGICHLSDFAPLPYSRGRIQISEAYWPYHRGQTPIQDSSLQQGVDQVRQLLEQRPCIQLSFSTADEILARQWLQQGITLERIEQAILLGCTRKYVAWRNHHDPTPIASLRYFEPVLQEIDQMQVSPDYWSYVRSRMKRMEDLWSRQLGSTPAKNDATANLVNLKPSSATPTERR